MSDILRILQITSGDSGKAIQKAVQKPYTQPYEKQGLPYAKLYKMAQLPYDAIQKAVQYSRKAIQCHTRSCTRWLESHTVRLNCHTMPYTKPYSTAEKPYSVHTEKMGVLVGLSIVLIICCCFATPSNLTWSVWLSCIDHVYSCCC